MHLLRAVSRLRAFERFSIWDTYRQTARESETLCAASEVVRPCRTKCDGWLRGDAEHHSAFESEKARMNHNYRRDLTASFLLTQNMRVIGL
jgi:hypothetical protein